MDKYEFNIKVEQIKKLVNKSDYETAMKIADTIDWKRVRNTNLLSMVALVYEKNEEYQEAKDILLMAFERAPVGKRLLYKLAELAVKEGNIQEAEAYYREFCDLSPEDPRQQLLRYMILKEKGAPAQQLIHSLESYANEELDEKWLYELAELYHAAGMGEKCVQICDKIMLMFGLGKYVDKAMELKIEYAPLTSYQMDLVENRDKYEAKLRAVEQEYNGIRIPQEPEEEYEEEKAAPAPIPAPAPVTQIPRNVDEELAANLKEAEVEESLAKEMSRISSEDLREPEPSAMERTRVFETIRSSRNAAPSVLPERETLQPPNIPEEEPERAIPQPPVSIYQENSAPEEEPEEEISPEPVVEEELVVPGDESLESVEPVQEEYEERYARESAVSREEVPYMQPEEEQELQQWNHFMVEARTPEKGLELAIETLKKIHSETGIQNQVVKISGQKLSGRGVFASADKLAGKDLIVEDAGDLTAEALAELNDLMDRDRTGLIVVLIDNPKQMEGLHSSYPDLASKFECIGSRGEHLAEPRIEDVDQALAMQADLQATIARETLAGGGPDVREPEPEAGMPYPEEIAEEAAAPLEDEGAPEDDDAYYDESEEEENAYPEPEYDDGEEMGIDEFAQYACKYANEIDCSITGKSMLALYERIEIMEEDGILLTKQNAVNLIEEAADRAEKPTFGKLIKGVFSSKYDKDGLLILKEEHFIS